MLRITRPEDINNNLINAVGVSYFTAHNKSNRNLVSGFFDSLMHTNHSLAIKLINYDLDSDVFEKWKFLANAYLALKNNNGELAKSIRKLFSDAFGKSIWPYVLVNADQYPDSYYYTGDLNSRRITTYALITIINSYMVDALKTEAAPYLDNMPRDKPDTISAKLIRQMGAAYLKNYGSEEKLLHAHQASARKLQSFEEGLDAHSTWIFLADVYATLKTSYGELSGGIINLFIDAFGLGVYTHAMRYMGRGGHYPDYHEPAEIAEALRGIANNYYAHQYRLLLAESLEPAYPRIRQFR